MSHCCRWSGKGSQRLITGPSLSFSTTVQRAPSSMSGKINAGIGLVGPPDLEAAGDAPCDQRPTGFEFRVPRVLDQDGALEVDPVVLAALAPDARGLLPVAFVSRCRRANSAFDHRRHD